MILDVLIVDVLDTFFHVFVVAGIRELSSLKGKTCTTAENDCAAVVSELACFLPDTDRIEIVIRSTETRDHNENRFGRSAILVENRQSVAILIDRPVKRHQSAIRKHEFFTHVSWSFELLYPDLAQQVEEELKEWGRREHVGLVGELSEPRLLEEFREHWTLLVVEILGILPGALLV